MGASEAKKRTWGTRGAVDPGETPIEAARREFLEETGITNALPWTKLGTTRWRHEDQYFFYAEIDSDLPDRFKHVVTEAGGDHGLRYRYPWLPIPTTLSRDLVQGSNRFLDRLTERVRGAESGR